MRIGVGAGTLEGMTRRHRLAALIVSCALIPAGCSGGTDTADSGTAAEASTPLVTSPSSSDPVDTIETTGTDAPSPGPRFSSDVLPIIQDNCASCHQAGGPGAAHFPMDTAAQLVAGATFIGTAAQTGYMPPWPASSAGLAFRDDRRLTDEQIATLAEWVDGGAQLDVPADTAVTPSRNANEPIVADQTLAGTPYRGTLDLVDDYRCQILDPKLTETSYVQGLEFTGDQRAVVHHALVFISTADARATAEAADAADPAVGFECGGLVSYEVGRTTLVNSWAPGQAPLVFPSDTAFEMGSGDFFTVQIHYHYSDETIDLPGDRSTLAVDFADADVIAAAGGALDLLSLQLYLPPAEIPCRADQVGPLCDRTAAIVDKVAGGNPAFTDVAVARYDGWRDGCGMTADEVAAMTDGVATASCVLPAAPGTIVSVWGHMHSLGSSFRMTLNPGQANERVLLDIPNWDYAWQLLYFPTEDVVLGPGDTIGVECTWDRSRDAHGAEPRYILWSEGTYDEMCYSQIVTRPTS